MNDEPQRPSNPDDRKAWKAYWAALGMPWRTEPEIDEGRRQYLAERRAVQPDIEKGLYPFRDENGGIKLTRADVEWLLVEHQSGGLKGPVDWSNWAQREREGLDLRGAHLRGSEGQKLDLHGLPLARIHAGPNLDEWFASSPKQREMAAIQLQDSSLPLAHLEGAILNHAHLERADLRQAHLEGAFLGRAHFEEADLRQTFFDLSMRW